MVYLFISAYYIQINTIITEHIFIIEANFQKTLGTSCLKFRHHLYGPDVEYLRYGYNDTLQRIVVNTISNNENFWGCSTFSLSSIPESAKGVSISFICYHEDKQKDIAMKERFKDTHVPGNQKP